MARNCETVDGGMREKEREREREPGRDVPMLIHSASTASRRPASTLSIDAGRFVVVVVVVDAGAPPSTSGRSFLFFFLFFFFIFLSFFHLGLIAVWIVKKGVVEGETEGEWKVWPTKVENSGNSNCKRILRLPKSSHIVRDYLKGYFKGKFQGTVSLQG